MKSGSNLEKILRAGHFAFTGELGPPRGTNVAAVREKAKHLVGMVDAVNITDNQTAMVRMSSWAASLIAIEEGLEPNYQMVCRDRNRLAMQADILGASALGIRNMLCLSGDHQQFGDHPQAKGVFDIDSTQLIGMVKKMRDEAKFLGGACAVEAMLKNVVNEPTITVHLATEVAGVNKNGNFKISLNKTVPAKDMKACEAGYMANPAGCAAVRGYSLNNSRYYLADGSLNTEMTGSPDTLEVDAVVVATGFTPFDPRIKSTYRYDDLENVVSGMDLESGKRSKGTVLRPSDGRPPKKIAFIQCVGSRDERLGNLWCSQVCCPYALRTAQAMKHKDPELEITVFYMDIQNTGNDFPVFYQKCKDDMRFVRNIPVDRYKTDDDRIRTRFMAAEGSSEAVDDDFDLVVLSVGIMPAADNASLSELVGTPLNGDGFFACTDKLNRVVTDQDGIFMAGTATGPKTIAESIVHAGQSAGEVMKYLGRTS